jgi:DNA-binding Lrp family transcriptional regulator
MDELDSALLALLQQDARQTNREMARKLGLAPSTCLERVRSLRERGVVNGYHAEVNLTALHRPVHAMVAARVRPPSRAVIEAFQQFVFGLPEVLSVFVVSGGDDFLIHIAVRDMEHLRAFVLDRLTQRKELADVRTSMVFEHMRKTVIEPLPEPPAGDQSDALR